MSWHFLHLLLLGRVRSIWGFSVWHDRSLSHSHVPRETCDARSSVTGELEPAMSEEFVCT